MRTACSVAMLQLSRHLRPVIAVALVGYGGTVPAGEPPDARTVIGGSNALLADGARALLDGDLQRGVALTHRGLDEEVSEWDRAAGLSNLCAGYVGLKQFEVALAFCNQALALNESNWRTWQNRAAAYLGMSLFSAALRDVEQGLTINPGAKPLLQTLTIVKDRERDALRRPRPVKS